MRIALVTTPAGFNNKGFLPNLGLGYLASSLERRGCQVRIFDYASESISTEKARDEILGFDPVVLGITSVTSDRFEVTRLCSLLKAENPRLFITAGGPHFALTAPDALQNISDLDAVVMGEGEITFTRLIDQIDRKDDLTQIRGLAISRGKEVIFTGQPERIDRIDEIPPPAWHLFNHELYRNYRVKGLSGRIAGVISSRGCPYRCAFCSSPAFWGTRYRLRSPGRFVDEIEFLKKEFGYSSFIFWDDTFTVNQHHVEHICGEIIRRKLNIHWLAAARINLASRNMFRTMKRAGCTCVNFGIESGSDRVLRSIHKETTVSRSHEAVKMALEEGLKVRAFFIFGHPDEEMEDAVQTIELIDQLRALGSDVSTEYGYLAIFPGTEVEKIARERGILPADFSWNHWYGEYDRLPSGIPRVPFYRNPDLDRDKLQALLWRMDLKSLPGVFRLFKRTFTNISSRRIRNGFRTLRKIM